MRKTILLAAILTFANCALAQYTPEQAKEKVAKAQTIYLEDDTTFGTPYFTRTIIDAAARDNAKVKRFTIVKNPADAQVLIVWNEASTPRTVTYRNEFGATISDPVLTVCMYVFDSMAAKEPANLQAHVLWHECETPQQIIFPDNMRSVYHDYATGEFKDFLKFSRP